MSLIPCTLSCRHQTDGRCTLYTTGAQPVRNAAQDGTDHPCLNYEPKDSHKHRNRLPDVVHLNEL